MVYYKIISLQDAPWRGSENDAVQMIHLELDILMTGCSGIRGTCIKAPICKWACPPPWFLWEGQCYKAIMKELTWFEAKDEGIKVGSVLVAPQSDEETQFLIKLQTSNFWINCNNIDNEGWLNTDPNHQVQIKTRVGLKSFQYFISCLY